MLYEIFIKRKHSFLSIFFLLFLFASCSSAEKPSFGPREDKGLIQYDEINEASGIFARLKNCDVITFKYPDGPRDAETILVDPLTRDIYIVSKREEEVNVYVASYPQSLKKTIIVKYMLTLPFTMIIGGDISYNGQEILLKTYDSVYYWKREAGQSVIQALTNNYYSLPYIREPQGEAIGWSHNADGYYTTSEEEKNIQAHFYFY